MKLVFTSTDTIPTWCACTDSINLITIEEGSGHDFVSDLDTCNNLPFSCCYCTMNLYNGFCIPCTTETNMHHIKIFIIIHFHIWTLYKPIIGWIRTCHNISILKKHILFDGGQSVYDTFPSPYISHLSDGWITLKSNIYEFNRLRNIYHLYTMFWSSM